MPTMSIKALEMMLKKKLSETHTYHKVGKAFHDMQGRLNHGKRNADVDTDTNDGSIGPQELYGVLNRFNIRVSETQCAELTDIFDTDNNGRISYDEFLEHFAPGIQQKREREAGSPTSRNKNKGVKGGLDIGVFSEKQLRQYFKNLFKIGDRDGNGVLDRNEIKRLGASVVSPNPNPNLNPKPKPSCEAPRPL